MSRKAGVAGLPLLLLLLAGCGVSGAPVTVSIPALSSEDLSGPCRFEVSMAHASHVQMGVVVLYERGDTDLLYNDAQFRRAIASLDYSIVWAYQCDAKSTGDLQADATKGPARMLFTALEELATQTAHPELSTNSVILYGFSAAGVLSATMAAAHPSRLVGVIEYAAGSASVDLEDVPIPASVVQIPTLILANALDRSSGTTRSLNYFERGRASGASWAFAVQNATRHCCNLSTRNIILPWIEEIATTHNLPETGTLNTFVCTPNGVIDAQGDVNCDITAASLGEAAEQKPQSHEVRGTQSGWLPDQRSNQAWLAWVTSLQTN
jgi:dienelactone hydrolase